MKLAKAFAEDHRRLHKRALRVSLCSIFCALLAGYTKVPDFIYAGVGLQIGAIFYGLASRNAAKAGVRAARREQEERLRELMGSPPT